MRDRLIKRLIIALRVVIGLTVITEIVWAIPVGLLIIFSLINPDTGHRVFSDAITWLIGTIAALLIISYPLVYILSINLSKSAVKTGHGCKAIFFSFIPFLNVMFLAFIVLISGLIGY